MSVESPFTQSNPDSAGAHRSLAPWVETAVYLSLLAAVEIVSDAPYPVWGIWLHAGLAAWLLVRAATRFYRPEGRFFAGLAAITIFRIVNFAAAEEPFTGIWYYLVVEGLLIPLAFYGARALGLSRRQLGLQIPRCWWFAALTVLSGFPLGWFEEQYLHPRPMAASLTFGHLWWPALVLVAATGLGEELFFRGFLQPLAEAGLGQWPGILATSIVWSLLHIVWHSSMDLSFVCLVGIFWGWVRDWTDSVWATSLAHGIVNILVFLVLPLLAVRH